MFERLPALGVWDISPIDEIVDRALTAALLLAVILAAIWC